MNYTATDIIYVATVICAILITTCISVMYNLPLWLTFVIFFIILDIYIAIYHNNTHQNTSYTTRDMRQAALIDAAIYLAPYDSIWSNLRLSNKFCSLYLESDGVTIRAEEKVEPFREFRIIRSKEHNYGDLWNMFCITFTYNETYEGLIEKCRLYKAEILETHASPAQQQNILVTNEKKKPVEKVDINNCSEVEMTALPGVSIVMAKKAVKKREDIGGFKSVDDFILFLKIKPHIEKQLREIICANKIAGNKKIVRNKEREVDL